MRGPGARSRFYGVFDIKRESLDGTRIQAADVTIDSRMGRTWGGLDIGGNYNRADRYAAYGEVTADSDFSDRYVISATAGFRTMR